MESIDEILLKHNLTRSILDDSFPDFLNDIPDHTLIVHNNKKVVKVSSCRTFVELCYAEKERIGNSELIVYASPHLSLYDAARLGISMGDLVCNGVVYKVGNIQVLDGKIKRNLSIVQKATHAETLLSEVKGKGRPTAGPDIEWFELNRRYACVRYVTSLMRTGSDKDVHDAIKACFKKTHSEIYGGNEGFDEWCQPDINSAE